MVLRCCLTLLVLPSRAIYLKIIQRVFENSQALAAEVFCSDYKQPSSVLQTPVLRGHGSLCVQITISKVDGVQCGCLKLAVWTKQHRELWNDPRVCACTLTYRV